MSNFLLSCQLATQRLPRPALLLPSDPNPTSDAATQPSTEDKDSSSFPLPSAPPLPTDVDLSPPLLPKGLGPKTAGLDAGRGDTEVLGTSVRGVRASMGGGDISCVARVT